MEFSYRVIWVEYLNKWIEGSIGYYLWVFCFYCLREEIRGFRWMGYAMGIGSGSFAL